MENFFARSQEQCTKFSTFTAVLGHHVLNLDAAVYGAVLLATGISRTFELLDFDEYCRFDTSAFFGYINRGVRDIPGVKSTVPYTAVSKFST